LSVAAALRARLGDGTVALPEEIEPRYLGDWILQETGAKPAALVRPRTTQEVSLALSLCHAHGTSVVPQGGRTGLAGGAVPSDGSVILALERMRTIGGADPVTATIEVEAGAVLQGVQEAADAAGMLFPMDIGGRGTCTIGGNISTNAGGNRVLRYGMMRELVLGLEAVLADGTVVNSMNTMLKNNAGYDLKQMFVGSEGTLGVVTRAVLRLFPKPTNAQTALVALKDYAAVVAFLRLARERLGATLSAFEAMWPDFYRLGTEAMSRRAPLPSGQGLYVLVESMGVDAEYDAHQFQSFVEQALGDGIVEDAVIARSLKEAREIWAVRDSSGDLPQTFWPYVGFDVSVPIGDIGRFIDDCRGRLVRRWPQVGTLWFGHVADSNIHICVRLEGAASQPQDEIDEIVYDCVEDFAGSVSAEHGIGLLKRAYLDRSRSAAELSLMRALKQTLDPKGILNPGKVL
jgi:FAD/FMN-containing dehydrogenase